MPLAPAFRHGLFTELSLHRKHSLHITGMCIYFICIFHVTSKKLFKVWSVFYCKLQHMNKAHFLQKCSHTSIYLSATPEYEANTILTYFLFIDNTVISQLLAVAIIFWTKA